MFWFVYVEPSLWYWDDESNLISSMIFLYCCWFQFANIFLRSLDFCTFIKRYWPVILLFGGAFAWVKYQGSCLVDDVESFRLGSWNDSSTVGGRSTEHSRIGEWWGASNCLGPVSGHILSASPPPCIFMYICCICMSVSCKERTESSQQQY